MQDYAGQFREKTKVFIISFIKFINDALVHRCYVYTHLHVLALMQENGLFFL